MATTANIGIISTWAVLAWLIAVLTMLATNPAMAGPVGVTAWFIVLLSALATSLTVTLFWLKGVLQLEQTRPARLRIAWRQGGLLAFYLTIILALASLRQLALRDAILLGAIFLFTEVFIRFRMGLTHE